MENRCVVCGEIIPEGRMVCPKCERGTKMSLIEKLNSIKVRRNADKEAIAEAISFINKIQRYREIQIYALSLIGYEPIFQGKDDTEC